MLTNIIATLAILCIIGGATLYIVKSKKRGGCIGCPYAKNCSGKCSQNNKEIKK